jgi:hypothetical protein
MTTMTDFISELVRAANEVEKLSEDESAQLLDHAYRSIRDARHLTGVAQNSLDRDPAIDS